MKRIGFLYEQIVSEENCRLAIINAAKHKKKRKNVMKVINNLDFYVKDLSERLVRLDFTSPYRTRIIKDGLSGKERELQIPAFYPDQCAHHEILLPLELCEYPQQGYRPRRQGSGTSDRKGHQAREILREDGHSQVLSVNPA